MFNFGEQIQWNNTPVLKVEGAAITEGKCVSAEGKEFNFTDNLMLKILSHVTDPIPMGLLHNNKDVFGYAPKVGYDPVSKNLPIQGFVFDNDKRKYIESHGFDKISPEITFVFDEKTGEPIDGYITKFAFVKTPAMVGTQMKCSPAIFSAPSHPWTYGKDISGSWSKPSLNDFTNKEWGDLGEKEKRDIAGHYAYSANMPPTSFGDLKFPHHNPKTNAVVWSAVANAMARLNQASLNATDKKEVYNHLIKHYKEFDKTAPAMFERCKDMNENNGMMVFYPSGTFTPTDTTTGTSNFAAGTVSVPIGTATFEAEISRLKTLVANFEAEVTTLKDQVVATTTAKSEVETKNLELEDKYKTLSAQYGVLMTEKTDAYVAELKKLGFTNPDAIGKDLPSEQRITILKQMKENFVVSAPGNVPTAPISVPNRNVIDKAALLAKMGISEENAKLIKVN
jgi:hypothetical protein